MDIDEQTEAVHPSAGYRYLVCLAVPCRASRHHYTSVPGETEYSLLPVGLPGGGDADQSMGMQCKLFHRLYIPHLQCPPIYTRHCERHDSTLFWFEQKQEKYRIGVIAMMMVYCILPAVQCRNRSRHVTCGDGWLHDFFKFVGSPSEKDIIIVSTTIVRVLMVRITIGRHNPTIRTQFVIPLMNRCFVVMDRLVSMFELHVQQE